MIDFGEFEEKFKLTAAGRALINGNADQNDGLMTYPSKRMKKQDNVSLLEHTRLRNIGKYSYFVIKFTQRILILFFKQLFQEENLICL